VIAHQSLFHRRGAEDAEKNLDFSALSASLR